MRTFVRSGALGTVRLGATAGALRLALGDRTSCQTELDVRRRFESLKYGDVEFHLAGNPSRVWLMSCEKFDVLNIGHHAIVDRWFFEGRPSMAFVERELQSDEIRFHRIAVAHDRSTSILRTEAGVELLFRRTDDPAPGVGVACLFGFQLVDRSTN